MGFIKCAVYAAGIGILSFLLGRMLPEKWVQPDHFPYRSFSWEKEGKIYSTLFHIKSWQAKVPDMSRIFPKMMQAKKVTPDFGRELPIMIRETCVAEFIHLLLCPLALPCLWLWPGAGGILFVIFYILLGNLPFIMIQRYNRPRLLKLQEKMAHTQKGKLKWLY